MAARANAQARRRQIAEAALELLADCAPEVLTTRQIAKRAGLTQPALFRHFRSREQILLAALGLVREDMGSLAQQVVASDIGVTEQLRALLEGIGQRAQARPGLPRLLFSLPREPSLRSALRQILGMHTGLVAELVRQGQREGVFARERCPELAAEGLVGLLQGAILRALLYDTSPRERLDGLFELWLRGMAPTSRPPASERPAPALAASGGGQPIVALDVRPLLQAGEDPLAKILAGLQECEPSGVMVVTAPFEPKPLRSLLAKRGYRTEARQVEPGCWCVDICGPRAGAITDLSELEAPEPLERVLQAESALSPGQAFLARLPRYPRLLLPHLEERAVRWAIHEYPDGGALLWMERAK